MIPWIDASKSPPPYGEEVLLKIEAKRVHYDDRGNEASHEWDHPQYVFGQRSHTDHFGDAYRAKDSQNHFRYGERRIQWVGLDHLA